MNKVYQTIIEKGNGNCLQASIASLLELELHLVPHFLEAGKYWCMELIRFVEYKGYSFNGTFSGDMFTENYDYPKLDQTLNGLVLASVPSRTLDSTHHSVIMNADGDIVHDPNPNKRWLNENVFNKKVLSTWFSITI